MRRAFGLLDQDEMRLLRATVAFLEGRLEETETIEWAVRLGVRADAEKNAVATLLRSKEGTALSYPWKDAWRLIEETWNHLDQDHDFSEYEFRARLASGERTSSLIQGIVRRVAGYVQIAPFADWAGRNVPRQPKAVTDLFSVSLTSGKAVNPQELGITALEDKRFTLELASALDLSVLSTLAEAGRMGWDQESSFWRLGGLNRVYYVQAQDRREEEHEPDEFHEGISPSVKLLHAATKRLIALDPSLAAGILDRWRQTDSGIHHRLWASLASLIVSVDEIARFLDELNQREFWDVNQYPEIAQLRAESFARFSNSQRKSISARLKRGPPRYLWRRDVEPEVRKNFQRYMMVRELRRIELASSTVPESLRNWYSAALPEFPDLVAMDRVDEGFPGTAKARSVPPNPDARFDQIEGSERLKALERALKANRLTWDDDPSQRASDWIRSDTNLAKVIDDLAKTARPGEFPRVWERVGWAHAYSADTGILRVKVSQANLVASLVRQLPEQTIEIAIEGLTWWFSNWAPHISKQHILPLWKRVWPASVRATNKKSSEPDDIELTHESAEKSFEIKDIDTLNNPVGRMTGVFLSTCPDLKQDPNPFRPRTSVRQMRDDIERASGHSQLIATHRLLEGLHYFLRADKKWANDHLVCPLREDTERALKLWHSIARRTHFKPTLQVLGADMVRRSTDKRLSRSTRQSLVFSLVVECLYALKDKRKPAVPFSQVEQTIRSVEDEVRGHAANVLQQYLREIAGPKAQSRARVFRGSVAPFLASVWPHERTLATPGVARALSDLPATSGDAFVEAVRAVSRFLVPFDAWSSVEYGLYGATGDGPKMDIIDTSSKAEALLVLLDGTIGTAEGSVVPHDLADMLAHIRKVAPNCGKSVAFRRLATAARI